MTVDCRSQARYLLEISPHPATNGQDLPWEMVITPKLKNKEWEDDGMITFEVSLGIWLKCGRRSLMVGEERRASEGTT